MPKKFFYRIEHNVKRVGPYNCYVNDDYEKTSEEEACRRPFFMMAQEHLNVDWNGEYHKTPHHDGLAQHVDFWGSSRFGFPSLKKVKDWFGDDHKIYAFMDLYGFGLYRYEVDERFDSERQSIAYIEGMENEKILDWELLFD